MSWKQASSRTHSPKEAAGPNSEKKLYRYLGQQGDPANENRLD
jgi:hypothetical protein